MLGQAGERRADVYVGVDVFARGNVVGGRFDTDKVGGGFRPRASGPVPPLGPRFLMDLPFPSAPQRNDSSCSSQSGYPVALRNRVSCPGQAVSPLKPLSRLFLQSDNVFLCGCYQTEVRCSPAVWSSAGLGLLSQLCSLTFPTKGSLRRRRGACSASHSRSGVRKGEATSVWGVVGVMAREHFLARQVIPARRKEQDWAGAPGAGCTGLCLPLACQSCPFPETQGCSQPLI